MLRLLIKKRHYNLWSFNRFHSQAQMMILNSMYGNVVRFWV